MVQKVDVLIVQIFKNKLKKIKMKKQNKKFKKKKIIKKKIKNVIMDLKQNV